MATLVATTITGDMTADDIIHTTGTWSSPAFAGLWKNYASTGAWGPCRYNKMDGVVNLRGLARYGDGSTDLAVQTSTVFTLPAGYRPSEVILFPTKCSNGTFRLQVSSAGSVQFVNTVASVSYSWASIELCFYVG